MSILIGKILKAQGIKGELKLDCYLDNVNSLNGISTVTIAGRRYKLNSVRNGSGFAFVRLDGINDRNAAELLKDWEVYADKSDIQLPDNRYFVEDVIGCKVYTQQGTYIGEVVDIEQYGSADVYSVVTPDGKTLSFPWIKQLEVGVDINNKKIIVNDVMLAQVSVYQDEN